MTICGLPTLANGMSALLPGFIGRAAPSHAGNADGPGTMAAHAPESSLAQVLGGGCAQHNPNGPLREHFTRATTFLTQATSHLNLPPAFCGALAGASVFLTPELCQAALQSGEALANSGSAGTLQAIATFGAGALGMAAAKRGMALRLNKAEKKQLEGIYREVPGLKKAFADNGWSEREKYDFISMVAEQADMQVWSVMRTMPKILDSLKAIKWPYQDKTFLVLLLIINTLGQGHEKETMAECGDPEVRNKLQERMRITQHSQTDYQRHYQWQLVLQSLPRIIQGMEKQDWTAEQMYRLLISVGNNTHPQVGENYESIAESFKVVSKTDWTKKERRSLLIGLIQYVERDRTLKSVYTDLPAAVEALSETAWTPVQQYDVLVSVMGSLEGVGKNGIAKLPATLECLNNAVWNPVQQYEVLLGVARNAGSWIGGNAYEFLPEALEALSTSGWSIEQQSEILIGLAKYPEGYDNLSSVLAGLQTTAWTFEQQSEFLLRVAELPNDRYPALRMRHSPGGIYFLLSEVLIKLKNDQRSPEETFLFFMRLTEQYRDNFGFALNLWHLILSHSSDDQNVSSFPLVKRMLAQLTDYNRERVIEKLREAEPLFHKLGNEHFLQNFELYVTLFERWPRLGFNLLEGVLEATQNGTIPQDIAADREKILKFVEETNGFIPSLYQAYLAEGDSLFPRLQRQARTIINDQFGSDEASRVIEENGEEYLLGLIQMASPTSGASFVQKSQQLGLMRRMIDTGDLRGHIPVGWQQRVEQFEMERGGYRLREGQVADPDGNIGRLLNQFRVSQDGDEIKEKDLVDALTEYLKSGREVEHRRDLQERLYQLAGQNDALKEKIDRIQDRDYSTLLLLEQLFGDKDNLQKLLAGALDKVHTELLEQKTVKQKIEGNAKRLVKSLKKVWQNQKSGGREQRIVILGNMLKGYEAGDIEAKILTRSDLSDELKSAIREEMDLTPVLSKKQIITEILAEPIQLIRQEMAKYSYQDLGHMKVGLRAVKGPTYGMNGLSSGVCTATDMELWKNPNFKLLAITDEDKGQVMGYIHVFETEIDGKKYLTLPGINPSAEFLGTVNARQLYDGIMEKVVAYAKAGDFHGVYVPTNPNVHSNRSDIQKAIKKAQYSTRRIPEVRWNTLPSPYPFDDVYVVWEGEDFI